MRPLVAVVHESPPEVQAAYRAALDDVARLSFLSGASADTAAAVLGEATGLLTFFPQREIACEPRFLAGIRFVQCLAAGRDRFPTDWFPAAAIAFNEGAAALPVAEHAVALVLAASKRLLQQHSKLREGVFDQRRQNLRLRGSRALIIGLGSIGREVARLLSAFGVTVDGVNRSGKTTAPVNRCTGIDGLPDLIETADIIVVCVEANPGTAGLIDAELLARMKASAILVNVARAAVIVEDDLYAHLQRHPGFTACLDAWWIEPQYDGRFATARPFLSLPNVVGSPHNAGQVPGIITDLAVAAANKLRQALEGS
ncbi:MAG: NAD(P)-dependent oxidoreductase [Lautropia sp.]